MFCLLTSWWMVVVLVLVVSCCGCGCGSCVFFFVAVFVIFAVTVLPTSLCFGSLFFQITDELVGQCMLLYTRVIAHQDQKWQAAVRMRKVKHHPGREAESYGLEVGQIFPVFHIYLTQMSLPLLYQESVSLFFCSSRGYSNSWIIDVHELWKRRLLFRSLFAKTKRCIEGNCFTLGPCDMKGVHNNC